MQVHLSLLTLPQSPLPLPPPTSVVSDDPQTDEDLPNPPSLLDSHSQSSYSIPTTLVPDALRSQRRPSHTHMPFGSTHMLDWNSRYQLLTLSRSDVKLTKLVEEFEYIAKGYGKVIVEERGMEIGMRTYTPLTAAGGVAGGEKYLVHGEFVGAKIKMRLLQSICICPLNHPRSLLQASCSSWHWTTTPSTKVPHPRKPQVGSARGWMLCVRPSPTVHPQPAAATRTT